ncbi:MAG TPA: glycosyltransferase family 1 protein [Abditibacteriaceae bacterium]|jgi:glycosyltransferase involved in cell wall biosynthesis
MHIGIDATALYGVYNGVERALWNLLSALHDIDSHNFYTIWIPSDGPSMEELAPFGGRWRWQRLSFRGEEKLRRIAWQQLQLPRLLRREACDVLHAPTYVAPLLARVPVVLTVYDLIALEQPEFATRANTWHYRAVLPASLCRAKTILVPSDAVAGGVAHRVGTEKVRVIAPGVEDIFFRKPTEGAKHAARHNWNLPDDFLLFVGNWEPKKNLTRLLAALETLAQTRPLPPLVIAGGGRAWGDGIPKPPSLDVRRIGYMPREALPSLYSLCTAFVFPSLAEGFGLPVAEALVCGAPVLASESVPIAGLREASVLCNPRDVGSIARGIEQLLADADLRVALAQRGRALSAEFSSANAARHTLAALEEAVA